MKPAPLTNPRAVVPASIMPAYPWLSELLDIDNLGAELATLARLGVPYDPAMIANTRTCSGKADPTRPRPAAPRNAMATVLVADFDGDPARLTEMDAVIAYLQSLGTQTRAAWSVAGEDKK